MMEYDNFVLFGGMGTILIVLVIIGGAYLYTEQIHNQAKEDFCNHNVDMKRYMAMGLFESHYSWAVDGLLYEEKQLGNNVTIWNYTQTKKGELHVCDI